MLRAPTLSDAPALAALGRATFTETFGTLYRPEDLEAFLTEVYAQSAIAKELDDPKLQHAVIELDGELIGFAKIGPAHLPVKDPAPGAMELWQIYLLKKHLGKGYGFQLMAWANEKFREAQASEIYLSVFSGNQRAITFYQKQGFEKIGEYDFPVGDHVDLEWIMRRKSHEPGCRVCLPR